MFSVLLSSLALGASVSIRAPVHPERAEQIKAINTNQSSWKAAAHPRFAAQPPGASKPLCGVKGSWQEDTRAKVAAGTMQRFVADPAVAIPDAFDSATAFPQCAKIINDIRDQSNCGCCWAFGGAEAASDRMCIATAAKLMLPLSAQDVCFCSNPDGCGGGQISTPWEYIQQTGAVTGGQFQSSGPFGSGFCADFTLPHCHHHGPVRDDPYPAEGQPGCMSQQSPQCPSACGSNATVPNNQFSQDKFTFTGQLQTAEGEAEIQQMIMTGGPVETAFTVFSDFENYAGGVYAHTTGDPLGGHAVKFVGWGVETIFPSGEQLPYWKVANSWNPYWGEQGYFRIKRGDNEGGIEDSVVGSAATAAWSRKL